MKNVYSVYKERGLTPLETIEKLKLKNPDLKDQKMGYAGRLDPMAEGVLVILVGDECKNRKQYERLPKDYTFTVLFGVETDSYDALGIIKEFNTIKEINTLEEKLRTFAKEHIGKSTQEYPPFSSPKVKGKPLYKWAREGKIHEIEVPKKEIEIYSFSFDFLSEMSREHFIEYINHYILKVNGVFRQEEILKGWIEFFKKYDAQSFLCATFTISCSSGTYVRSLAHDMGKKLGCGAIAIQIKRTRVGEYSERNSTIL